MTTTDSFEKGKKKLKEAEVYSDLTSGSEIDIKQRRRSRAQKRATSSNSEDDETPHKKSVLPVFPKPKSQPRNQQEDNVPNIPGTSTATQGLMCHDFQDSGCQYKDQGEASMHGGGWCGRGDRPRSFQKRSPIVCYDSPAAVRVDRQLYDTLRHEALTGTTVQELVVPKRSARTWTLAKGDLCRISLIEGSQVGDVNLWNLHNPKERFYSGKTRQLHATHLTTYDRLWSNLPYLSAMATVVADSIHYGFDEDGAGVHDVIGTRCDDYTYKLITGQERDISCHSNLTKAAQLAGLKEEDVHDVWNIFMCTGFTKDTHQYFAKASPAQKGDYIEFIAEMDLLVGMATCPQGDVSMPVGQEVPENLCHPLGVQVFRTTNPTKTLP